MFIVSPELIFIRYRQSRFFALMQDMSCYAAKRDRKTLRKLFASDTIRFGSTIKNQSAAPFRRTP